MTANLYEAVEVWMGDLQDGMCMAIRGKLAVDIMDWTRLDDVLVVSCGRFNFCSILFWKL